MHMPDILGAEITLKNGEVAILTPSNNSMGLIVIAADT